MNPPPPSKESKPLPLQEVLMEEMKIMTAPDIVALIIAKTKANEKVTVYSGL